MGKIFDKLRIQGRMQIFEKMSQSALNHVLILQKDRTQKMLQIPLKIIDLQNDFNILVAKQWKIRISVPMSYIRLFENLAVLEKWYGMESRSVMEPAVLLLVSLPCTIGIELRSYDEYIRKMRCSTNAKNVKNVKMNIFKHVSF